MQSHEAANLVVQNCIQNLIKEIVADSLKKKDTIKDLQSNKALSTQEEILAHTACELVLSKIQKEQYRAELAMIKTKKKVIE